MQRTTKIAVTLVLGLALSACGNKEELKREEGPKEPPKSQPLPSPSPIANSPVEGNWTTGCIKDKKQIRYAKFTGDTFTWTIDQFSDEKCTGPGQPETWVTNIKISASTDTAYTHKMDYLEGDFEDLMYEYITVGGNLLKFETESFAYTRK